MQSAPLRRERLPMRAPSRRPNRIGATALNCRHTAQGFSSFSQSRGAVLPPPGLQAFLLAASLVGLNEGIAAAEVAYRCATTIAGRAVADRALACLEAGDVLGVIG